MIIQVKINQKLEQIKKVFDTDFLLDKPQNNEEIRKYYKVNALPYRLFHNYRAYA